MFVNSGSEKSGKGSEAVWLLRKNVPIEKTKKIYDFLLTKSSIWITIEVTVSYLLI